jgi:hypothetical protein
MDEKQMVDAAIQIVKDRSKDIYDDGLKPATKEGGEALQTLVGLVNHVVFYPIKKANITYKYKLEQFQQDLLNRMNKIPDEKFVEPPLTIAGPTIEALKYTFDTKELREMYIGLLSSTMNIETTMLTHPAYVEIIKQMSPIDATIFRKAVAVGASIACARVEIRNGSKFYRYAMPEMFVPDLLNEEDPFLFSSSIKNLCRLGLLTHRNNTLITDYDYDSFRDHPFVKKQLEIYTDIINQADLSIKIDPEVIVINDFGRAFARVCLE